MNSWYWVCHIGSCSGSSVGSFLFLTKFYRVAVATMMVRVVCNLVRRDIVRQGNKRFQVPNIRSTVFRVRIWEALYRRSRPVTGFVNGVITGFEIAAGDSRQFYVLAGDFVTSKLRASLLHRQLCAVTELQYCKSHCRSAKYV